MYRSFASRSPSSRLLSKMSLSAICYQRIHVWTWNVVCINKSLQVFLPCAKCLIASKSYRHRVQARSFCAHKLNITRTHMSHIRTIQQNAILTARNREVGELVRMKLVHNRQWNLCARPLMLAAKRRQPDQSTHRSNSAAMLETFVQCRWRDFL